MRKQENEEMRKEGNQESWEQVFSVILPLSQSERNKIGKILLMETFCLNKSLCQTSNKETSEKEASKQGSKETNNQGIRKQGNK